MLEWFRPGEHDRVDRVLDDMATLGVTELRTGISWADACTPDGEDWYAWLFPQLARRVNVLPCFVDTPPGWGVAPKTSAPPGITSGAAVPSKRHGPWPSEGSAPDGSRSRHEAGTKLMQTRCETGRTVLFPVGGRGLGMGGGAAKATGRHPATRESWRASS